MRRQRGWRAACMGILLACLPNGVAAQTLPPSDAAAALAALAAGLQTVQSPAPVRRPVSFLLREVVFAGPSGYLSPERLRAAVAPFIGRKMTAAAANALADAVNALYDEEGIDFAQAWVAGVDPSRGVVTLEMFEARLGRVLLLSQRHTKAYLDRRLGLRPGALADTRLIGARLERLSLTDGVLADAGFSPGAAPGTTDLTIRFTGPQPMQGSVRLDNDGADPKLPRLTGRLQFNSLSGVGDTLSFDLFMAKGTGWLSASYLRPVGTEGTRLSFGLSGEWEQDDGGLDQQGRQRSLSFDMSHPLALGLESSLWMIASVEAFEDQASVLGVASKDQRGVAVSLELTGGHNPVEGREWAASWNVGVTTGRYDDAIAGLDHAAFGLLFGSAQAVVPLAEWGQLSLSGGAQVTTGAPIPLRYQFSVTSTQAVAGYPPGLSTGEAGLWGRAQLQGARPVTLGQVSLSAFAFVAAGQAFDRVSGNWQGQGVARAAGIGLSGRWGTQGSFGLQLAWPLSEVLGQGGASRPSLSLNLATTF